MFLALFGVLMLAAVDAAAASPAGAVNYVIMADSSWDTYTSNPTAAQKQWFQANSFRMETFSPYFDSRLSWYANAWVYQDLYAIYTNGSVATAHPEWILRDSSGNKLYIPWGCGGGTCPQYAGDIANPAFRNWWISQAQQLLTTGYKGLWVDDVNLDFRVGDGNANAVTPMDSQTGAAMTYTNWRLYMAQFTEQIRAALPGWEIVHNAIWYADTPARTSDPYVQREIAAANFINLERGVIDGGLTGGTGTWSLNALFAYIDAVHALGTNVVLDNASSGSLGYELASYFLISNGSDGVSSNGMLPNNWWKGFQVDLGAAQGARSTWQGLLRRDFSGGMALVNPPQSATVTAALPGTFYTVDGIAVNSVTIGPADGIVLLGSVSTPGFSLSASPSSMSLVQGNGGASTITVASMNGFNSAVALTVSGCPSNATCGLSPSPVTPPMNGSTTTTLSVNTTPGTPAGTYSLVVSGNGGAQTATVMLTVSGQPDFSLSASPSNMTVTAGSGGSATVTIGSINGFNNLVSLAVSGCPTNATCSANPSSVTPASGGSATATVAINTGAATPAGSYTVTVSGNEGVHTATVALTVQAAPTGDFSLTATPSSASARPGSATSFTFTMGSLNGFHGTVALSVSGCPSNVTCVLSPASGTLAPGGSATAVLNVSAGLAASAGSYSIVVTAAGNGIVHSSSVSFTVTLSKHGR